MARGMLELVEDFLVPLQRVDVEEHRAAGVRVVGDVDLPPVKRQIRNVSMLPKSSSPARPLRAPLPRCRAAI